MTMATPRGIRNKNPLNIRIGNDWMGESPVKSDPLFEEFVSMEYGLRAGFIILRRYIQVYHRDTIRKIISSWAPSVENSTARYVQFVADDCCLDPDERLFFYDVKTMVALVSAMAYFECGVRISRDVIMLGYKLVPL